MPRIEDIAKAETEARLEEVGRQMEGAGVLALNLVVSSCQHRLTYPIIRDRSQTRIYLQEALDRLHGMALEDPAWVEREAAFTDMMGQLATSALRDMLEHANNTIAVVDSYGAACIWIDRIERELTERETAEANA